MVMLCVLAPPVTSLIVRTLPLLLVVGVGRVIVVALDVLTERMTSVGCTVYDAVVTEVVRPRMALMLFWLPIVIKNLCIILF